jgi:uncharacterized small protein (DUF1192 family)
MSQKKIKKLEDYPLEPNEEVESDDSEFIDHLNQEIADCDQEIERLDGEIKKNKEELES